MFLLFLFLTSPTFDRTVRPFVERNCATCHNEKLANGNINLDRFRSAAAALEAREVWERALQKVQSGEMPPAPMPRPAEAQIKAVARWFEIQFARLDRRLPPDPGRVTARRLNRAEYNNTVRDLLAVDFRPADDFPADDSGYGFDNIGDVLSLSPVLMEKYLAVAEKIARAAVAANEPVKPTRERFPSDRVAPSAPGAIALKHKFTHNAEYEIRVAAGGRSNEGELFTLGVSVDGQQVKTFEVQGGQNRTRQYDYRATFAAGEHHLRAAFIDDAAKAAAPDRGDRTKYLVVDYIEVRGPFNAGLPPITESHKRLFVCTHGIGEHQAACARPSLTRLARRAYRRPVIEKETDSLVRFVEMAQKEGESFEHGMRLAVQALLVSPQFLFRIERHPEPTNPTKAHRISDHELATRLAYFLWSSMPDDELLRLADLRRLRNPVVLRAQVRRMLRDPKAEALADNFAGQWLQTRNIESHTPDPDRFTNFDRELREAMLRETRLFFQTIVQEDRSIFDFIDGRFTFLNERLAKHYGIPGITGSEFRRLALDGVQRSGVLTHASVLTVSSYPTRTSPVLRGKWILENILNAPPPPPLPDVPNIEEAAVGNTGTLRQQLEKHRSNVICSSCHARMDPLGFGLENYDAIGAWRTRDGKFPVDATGTLPGGKSFRTPAELKAILKADRPAFTRGIAEKLLTYALGRGLERYDAKAVNSISQKTALGGYRFSRLVEATVTSMPFQMRRGEGKKS